MKKSVRVFYIPVWFLIKNMAAEEKKKICKLKGKCMQGVQSCSKFSIAKKGLF